MVDRLHRLAAFGYELPLHVPPTVRTSRSATHLWTHSRFLTIGLTSNAEYYRQTPPKVPNFYNTLFRRKLVLCGSSSRWCCAITG